MNRMDIDLDLIRDSSNALIKFFDLKGLDSLKCYELFKGIFELTDNYIKDGATGAQLEFDATEICNSSDNPQKTYEASKEFIKRHNKAFQQQVEKHQEDLVVFFNDSNCEYIPTIDSTHSDGGHKKHYFIGISPISDKSLSNENIPQLEAFDSSLSLKTVSYKTKQLPKPLPWIKPLLEIKLDGWKSKVFVGLPVFGIIYGLALLLWNLFYLSQLSLIITIISTLFYFAFYKFLRPFYDAMHNRVGMAPSWMLSMDVYEAQLRAKKSGEKWDNGKHKRILEVVIFEAECSICGSVVSVTRGKGLNKGRLIGVCDESPREHVFSFDHVTKMGKKLF